MTATIMTITGATGVGKTTLCRLLETRGFPYIASTTTRQPRLNEVVGRDLHVVTADEYACMRRRGEFLAPVRYAGADYGVQRRHLAEASTSDAVHTLIVEPSGLADIKRWTEQAHVGLFSVLMTLEIHQLRRQLLERYSGQMRSGECRARIARAVAETAAWRDAWDYDVVSTNNSDGLLSHFLPSLIREGWSSRRSPPTGVLCGTGCDSAPMDPKPTTF